MISIEQAALARIVDDRNILPFIDAGIKTEFFTNERWNRGWQWIHDYWRTHGEVPPRTAFERTFPSWEFESTDEPVSGIIEYMIQRRKQTLIRTGVVEVTDLVRGDDYDSAMQRAREMLAAIDIETSQSMLSLSSDIIGEIIVNAINRTDTTMMVGIPTGFPTIDEATGGLQPEQLVTITATPKAGKSSVLVRMLLEAQSHAHRCGLITFEMSGMEMMQRHTSVGAQLGLTNLQRGVLTPGEISKLRFFEEQMLDLPDVLVIHDTASVMTVGAVASRLQQHDLDVLYIDGSYLMDDEEGEPGRSALALTHITTGLKRLAQRQRIPIVQTTQSLISRTDSHGRLKLGSIGYSSSFGQDSDVVIGLERPDLMLPQAILKILAARNAMGAETELTFDYTIGIIEEMMGGGFSSKANKLRGFMADGD